MKLKSKFLGLETGGKPIVILNKEDAAEIGIRTLGRVKLKFGKKEETAIVNTTTKVVPKNFIGVSEELAEKLKIKDNEEIDVDIAPFPLSLSSIINKLKGRRLTYEEILQIVKDVVSGNLSEIEIAAFVTALNTYSLDLDEAAHLASAMFETGQKFTTNKKPIFDKHSIGGVPGDKTTLLVVPIVAAAGLTIPKTSSRSVTSAAGTADRAEVLMKVDLDIDEMRMVVEQTGGCFVWGGSLRLAPADDIFIQVEFPLGIDPLLLSSIMAKKRAVGANYLVIDIPTGRGTKIKTIGEATLLAKDFLVISKKMGIETKCAITYGEQPIGHTLGPALETKEALEVIMRQRNSHDLIDKSAHVAGILLEMGGKKNGESLAKEILKSGKAEQKLREIIGHQQGDAEVKPEDIKIGEHGFDYHAEKSGIVLWIDNALLVEAAKMAGAPKDKGAGVYIYPKMGYPVKKGEKLFTIYAEKTTKLQRAEKVFEEEFPFGVGERMEMLIKKIEESKVPKKSFVFMDR